MLPYARHAQHKPWFGDQMQQPNTNAENFWMVPARVVTAMEFLRIFHDLPRHAVHPDMVRREHALTPEEVITYRAALEVLRLYFTSEMDFGGPPARSADEPRPAPSARKRRGLFGRE
jgi:hypothetical protein